MTAEHNVMETPPHIRALLSERKSLLWRKINYDESIGSNISTICDGLFFTVREDRVVIPYGACQALKLYDTK